MAKTPVFTSEEAIAKLRQAVHGRAANFYAMYSSILGGIITDPALMVVPLDDHMVHRGHGVFDTATLTDGMLYQLDPHLDRLIKSASGARIPLPVSGERLRQIILETGAASRQRDTGAVVAPHAIDIQGGRQGLNCRAKEGAILCARARKRPGLRGSRALSLDR